jgi:hypothetical protein
LHIFLLKGVTLKEGLPEAVHGFLEAMIAKARLCFSGACEYM